MPFYYERFSNNAITTLAASISASDTTIHVDNPANFPDKAPFRIIIEDEIMRVTNRSGALFTVERGVEDTAAVSHNAGVNVAHVVTKQSFLNSFEFNEHANCRLSFSQTQPYQVEGSGSTLYAVPVGGNKVSLLDIGDGHWRNHAIESGIPLGLGGFASGDIVDVFVYYDEANHRLALDAKAWSSSSTRNPIYDLVVGSGVEVRVDNHGYRYLGTLAMWNTGQGINHPKRRFLWNRYNQIPLQLYHRHNFISYTYSTNLVRWLNNNQDNRVEFVCGLDNGSYFQVDCCVYIFQSTSSTTVYTLGLGYDTDITMTSKILGAGFGYYSTLQVLTWHADWAAKGRHYLQALERAAASVTVYGSNGVNYQGGIYGYVMG